MSSITAIVTAYRRPKNIQPLVDAVRRQSVPPASIWAWANEPNEKMKSILAEAKLDRVVTSSENAYFHGRFALALLAQTEFVAIFDDDTIPGENWFANCLNTITSRPGILGTAGVLLHEVGYARRTMYGWQRPSEKTVEVDLVGQAWFLRTEWVKHLFAAAAVTGTNGEDIELAARAWRLAGIRSFCPPHPANDHSRWGSTRGLELGIDEVAASLRVEHLAERKRIVEAEISAGWQPLFMRGCALTTSSVGNALRGVPPAADAAFLHLPPGEGWGEGQRADISASVGNGLRAVPPAAHAAVARPPSAASEPAGESFIYTEIKCGPRWITQYSYPLDETDKPRQPALVTLRIDGLEEGPTCCLECLDTIESLGGHPSVSDEANLPQYDCIECGAALEQVRDPLSLLRRARRLLTPAGQLLASVANARNESVIRGLLEGRWQEEESVGNGLRAVPPAAMPLRFFTRREIEKLFYRAGFRVSDLSPSPSLPLSPSQFGFSDAEAAELQTARYQITAVAENLPDYGLTSIVIVTHNQLSYTHACLESIRFVTDEPYELIVVDNGSTDGTVDYLRSCPGLTLIENAENRGFPAAVNQGIIASSGEQVLLLNNDVLVTTGWLRRMLEALASPKSKVESPKSAEESGVRSQEPRQGPWHREQGTARNEGVRGREGEGEKTRRSDVEANGLDPSSLISHPSFLIGLVGPLTNNASGYQEIAAGYTDLACLDGFAWEHAKQYAGQVELVDRLIGFCLLIRREVIDDISLLDERFGIGNYEDDDYCRRAQDAGWRLAVAQDAYIHHFGHCTFEGAGVDLQLLLDRNRQLYEEKWGEGESRKSKVESPKSDENQKESVGNGLCAVPSAADAAPSSLISHPSSLPLLSLCMIVRNNASTIRPALESAKPWFDEMIVVDTGSTDETPEICRELGAKVYHFPWPDSFAIARNESLKYARGEWVFWMDSDDVIDADNGRKLRALVTASVGNGLRAVPPSGEKSRKSKVESQTKENRGESGARSQEPEHQGSGNRALGTGASEGGSVRSEVPPLGEQSICNLQFSICNLQSSLPTPPLSHSPSPNILGYVMQVHCPTTGKDGFTELTVVDHVELIRNRPDLCFEGRVHEQIIPAIRRAGGDIAWTDLFVVHKGSDESPAGKQRKLTRDLRLLQLELRDHPDSSFAHFNLGMTYDVAGQNDEAVVALRRCLELSDPGESQVRKAYALLIGCLAKLGRHDEAREKCQQGLELFPRDVELLFRAGQVAHHFGQFAEAESAYRAVLTNDEPRHFTSIDAGILGFKTHHNLALVYADMNDLGRSEAEWRRATMAAPDYRDGWRGLGEALARQGRYDELAKLAPDLLARPALRGLGLAWRAQPARARGEFSAAGALLQGAIDELPDDIDVVQACCQWLFEMGDAAECERAIAHLLSLVPDNAGAHHNLGTLYLRMGRFADAVAAIRKSIELSPKNAAAYLHLGHALVADGQRDEAVRAWADALRLEPGNRQALEALTRAGSPPADNKSQSAAPLAAVMLKPSDGYGASPTGQSLGA